MAFLFFLLKQKYGLSEPSLFGMPAKPRLKSTVLGEVVPEILALFLAVDLPPSLILNCMHYHKPAMNKYKMILIKLEMIYRTREMETRWGLKDRRRRRL